MRRSIEYLDYYIPDNYIDTEDILKMNCDNEDINAIGYVNYLQQFMDKTHLEKVSVFKDEDEFLICLEKMLEKMLSNLDIDPLRIKYVISGNETFVKGDVSVLHYICERFGLQNAVILPLHYPCLASVSALGLSERLLVDDQEEYILAISNGKQTNLKDRFVGFTILGDGASVLLIKNDYGRLNIDFWEHYTNGQASYSYFNANKNLKNIPAIQKHLILNGVNFIKKSMKKNNLIFSDIDKIIQVNTNYEVWSRLYPQLLEVEQDKFYLDNSTVGGHINDVDYVRNLKDYINVKENDKNMTKKIAIYGANLTDSNDVSYNYCVLSNKTNI